MSTTLPGSHEIGPASAIWESTAWRGEAERWVDAQLERRGAERSAEPLEQVRLKPWSTLLLAQTPHWGRMWFKAVTPEATSEVEVLRILGSVAPDAVPNVWADDAERSWVLVPDQGPVLRDVETDDTAVSLMSAVLRRYGRLQRSTAPVVDQLRAAGVPNMTPREIAKQWQALHLTPDTAAEVRRAASRLEDIGMPMTIQHDNLHAGKVFADGTTSGMHEARIFDWSESSIGHPLCSLLTPLLDAGQGQDHAETADVRSRLFRAYVSVWSDVVSSSTMTAALDDAVLIARVGQVLKWRRLLARASSQERREWGQRGQQLIKEINETVARRTA